MRKFDLDDAKSRPLVMQWDTAICRRLTAGRQQTGWSQLMTSRFPVSTKVLITDRNRFDLDWKSGEFTWRYRNRLQVEGPVPDW